MPTTKDIDTAEATLSEKRGSLKSAGTIVKRQSLSTDDIETEKSAETLASETKTAEKSALPAADDIAAEKEDNECAVISSTDLAQSKNPHSLRVSMAPEGPTAKDIETEKAREEVAHAALSEKRGSLRSASTTVKQQLPSTDDIKAEKSAETSAGEILVAAKKRLSVTKTAEKSVLPTADDIAAEKKENDCALISSADLAQSKNSHSLCVPTASEDFMTIGGGVSMRRSQYLAGYKEEKVATYPTVNKPKIQVAHALEGTIDDVFKAHSELKTCLYNDVKVCPCGKSCAFTLLVCNSCGEDLPTETTKSENVFAAFLFGVKSAGGGFPYTISLRRETKDVVVFDDMLQLCPIHLNGIPKNYYIPDWRYLLICPRESLALLDLMEAELWTATQVFLRNSAFRETIYREGVTDESIKQNIRACFNFPPSQFQLHMQWLVPPMMPFQHFMAETKNHFHEGRAFSLSYVRNCLALNEPYHVEKDTPIESIIAFYKKLGVDYENQWKDWFHTICLGSDLDMQNWNAKDFQYVVQNGKAYDFSIANSKVVLGDVVSVGPREIQIRDKVILQNYGRPYVEGKPGGTYIQKPLEPKFGEGGWLSWPPVKTLLE